jgi:hypothetical protein
MSWCLKLRNLSEEAYNAVSLIMTLPSGRTLQTYKMWTAEEPGVNRDFLLHLSKNVLGNDLTECEKGTVLAFDGMKHKDGWVYSQWNGELVGGEDFGGDLSSETRKMFTDIRGDTTPEVRVAKEVFQFMLTTHDGRHRVAVGYYLVQSTSASIVNQMVRSVIIALHEIGLSVHAAVCDGA